MRPVSAPRGHIPHGNGCMYIQSPKVLPKHFHQKHHFSGSGGVVDGTSCQAFQIVPVFLLSADRPHFHATTTVRRCCFLYFFEKSFLFFFFLFLLKKYALNVFGIVKKLETWRINEPRHEKKQRSAYAKTKTQISFAVNREADQRL